MAEQGDHFLWLLGIADDHLVLAHRLSEWCGHAPMLEEDLALPNVALDLLGQARALYSHAGAIEGRGRDEDALAYRREEREYRNLLLVERPNGDFAHTMLRLFLFAAFMEEFWTAVLASRDATLAAIAAKAVKETRYHVRHAAEWVIRLGDGTGESARRLGEAQADLAHYTGEMFQGGPAEGRLAADGIAPDLAALRAPWAERVAAVFREACLAAEPVLAARVTGGRQGRHGEEMGHLLAELQYVQRTWPGLVW